MAIPSRIPHLIPDIGDLVPQVPLPAAAAFGNYDVAIGGVKFLYANTAQDPNVRQTAPFEKQRIDQAETAGEQTLTGWWVKSQDSFHGGAGQLQLEPAVPTAFSHVRYDLSKNADVFTPGRVARLPDTVVVSTDTCIGMVGVQVSGADAIAYVTSAGAVKLLTVLDGTPATTAFSDSTVTGNVTSITTDGVSVYVANHTKVIQLDPTNVSAAVTVATYPATATDGVVGWSKARLMLGVAGGVYQLDVTAPGATLTTADALFIHPTTGYKWRCFAESPTAILAAGDATGVSIIFQFDTTQVAGVPTLQADGQIAGLPIGERVLSMVGNQGTYLGIGTTKGFRVGSFDSYFSRLSYGPLELLPTDPTIPCNTVLARDRFFYAVGMDYDEGGLIAIDLGTKTEPDAGRFAWSPHLVTPAVTATAATAGCTLPATARVAFYVAGTGICLEGVGAGTGREAWVRTSRIRYGTTEPKLFKWGRVRGDLTTGEVMVEAITPTDTTVSGTFGFATIDPVEFRLPAAPLEWLQLKLSVLGSDTALTSYQVKALSGTRRQRNIQPVLSLFDNETTRSGLEVKDRLGSRARLEALESLDAAGDSVLFQEFTARGVISTVVVIDQVKFVQSGRPTDQSDTGGVVQVLMRTVEG